MDEISVRSITIGVSVFLFMITLTVAILYVNTAKNLANQINDNRQNIAVAYDNILNADVTESTITGNDFINFVKDNLDNDTININIKSINGNIASYSDITRETSWKNEIGNLADGKVSMIKSSDKVTLTKTIKNDNIVLIDAEVNIGGE